MRANRIVIGAVATAAALVTGLAGTPVPALADVSGGQTEYTVMSADGVAGTDAITAIERAGGRVVARNDDVGMYEVMAAETGFVESASASASLVGATRRVPIGAVPGNKLDPVENEAVAGPPSSSASTARPEHARPVGMDPLDDKAWGLHMVRADLARRVTTGDRRVTVGVLDSGIDASSPDIAPNFSWSLSRVFAPDIPAIDGPCESANCIDAVGTDDNGHGTHVAGTIGAAANGIGVSGIAPNVTLVELKGGQDGGFLFLQPVVDALTYAGNIGIDVVNMSFYVDPWLYNCTANPADSPEQQAEQRTIIAGMTRAMRYAHRHGVTMVVSMGNNHEDVGHPRTDTSSPDYPPNTTHSRPIDNASCIDLPLEGPDVIGVSALGPSGKKADYSNYGVEQITVSAPGGFTRDGFGTPTFNTVGNQVLSTYPKKRLQERGLVDANGDVVPTAANSVFKDCTAAGVCGYYTYLQGTSMAAPHATGVAALIVSRFGHRDPFHRGGLRMDPDNVERVLTRTAAEHACPDPPLLSYAQEGRAAEFDALCVGDRQFNGFYGFGIVDAFAAVTGRFAD